MVLELINNWNFITQTGNYVKSSKRLTYSQFEQMLTTVDFSAFKKDLLGTSEEGRPVHQYTFGNGTFRIIAWSQMHGNEATATFSLIDLMNWLSADATGLKDLITISLIPVLNPDGAEAFTRRNAYGIDMNRDAVSLQSNGAKMLMEAIKAFKPDVAFNLHDQRSIFHLERTWTPATISFLAPSVDVDRSINDTRSISMQWIVQLQELLKKVHPEGAAKYSDEFYPTAFGENVQSLGIPTILIESGHCKGDQGREWARRLNTLCLMFAVRSGAHPQTNRELYWQIPMNAQKMVDIVLRNVAIGYDKKRVDLAFMIDWKWVEDLKEFKPFFLLHDLGDLVSIKGHYEQDMQLGHFENGKRLPILNQQALFEIYHESYTYNSSVEFNRLLSVL